MPETPGDEKKIRYVLPAIFVLGLIIGFVFWLYSSSPPIEGQPAPSETVSRKPVDYFELLRKARRQLRESDGYLPGTYRRLVAAGQPEALIKFIRQNFQVVSGGENRSWKNAVWNRRWGSRGLLRGGSGTPRELADLLNVGLREMGLNSRVVAVDKPQTLRPFVPYSTSPDLNLDTSALQAAFPGKPLPKPARLQVRKKFWQSMADLIPKNKIAVRPFVETFTRLPTVQFTKDGVTYVGNLWDLDDRAYVESPVVNAGRSGDTPWVTVTLKVAMADRPNDPITVAKGRWRTETIAGGQIHATFVPVAGSPEELLGLPPRYFTSFLPTLRVTNPVGEEFTIEGDQDASQPKVIMGDPFTLDGQVFEERSGNWSPRLGRVGQSGQPEHIASLQITRVIDGHYPWVGLDVEAKDSRGIPVPEVPLHAFQASMDASPAPVFLEHNRKPMSRVLFLLDVSTSVADEFRGAAATGLVQKVARSIRKGSPKSQFRVGLVSGTGASLLSWRENLDDLKKDVGHFGMGSPLWRAAGEVSEAGASAVVFITDGHAADREGPILEPDEMSERSIRAGPPFVMISAVKPDQTAGPAIQTLADLTGGTVVNIDQPDRVADEVIKAIQQQSAPYRFWVRVDQEKESHEIKLGLTEEKVAAKALVLRPPQTGAILFARTCRSLPDCRSQSYRQ